MYPATTEELKRQIHDCNHPSSNCKRVDPLTGELKCKNNYPFPLHANHDQCPDNCRQPWRTNKKQRSMSEYMPRLLKICDSTINCKVVQDHGFALSKYASKLSGYVTKAAETEIDITDFIIGSMRFVCSDCKTCFAADGTKRTHKANCLRRNIFTCQLCNGKCDSVKSLNNHMRTCPGINHKDPEIVKQRKRIKAQAKFRSQTALEWIHLGYPIVRHNMRVITINCTPPWKAKKMYKSGIKKLLNEFNVKSDDLVLDSAITKFMDRSLEIEVTVPEKINNRVAEFVVNTCPEMIDTESVFAIAGKNVVISLDAFKIEFLDYFAFLTVKNENNSKKYSLHTKKSAVRSFVTHTLKGYDDFLWWQTLQNPITKSWSKTTKEKLALPFKGGEPLRTYALSNRIIDPETELKALTTSIQQRDPFGQRMIDLLFQNKKNNTFDTIINQLKSMIQWIQDTNAVARSDIVLRVPENFVESVQKSDTVYFPSPRCFDQNSLEESMILFQPAIQRLKTNDGLVTVLINLDNFPVIHIHTPNGSILTRPEKPQTLEHCVAFQITRTDANFTLRALPSKFKTFDTKIQQLYDRIVHELQTSEIQNNLPEVMTYTKKDIQKSQYYTLPDDYVTPDELGTLLMYIEKQENTLILAEAGTGKTVLMMMANNKLIEQNEKIPNMYFVALSGRVASMLHGSTFHAFLGITNLDLHGADLLNNIFKNDDAMLRILTVDILFLDEVGWIGAKKTE